MEIEIGQQLQYYMNLKNLTQRQVADKIQVRQNTISRWVNNICQPDASDIYRLCELFECSPNDLFDADYDLKNSNTVYLKVATDILLVSDTEKKFVYEKNTVVPILKRELHVLGVLNQNDMFAYRIYDDSMKPWYIKNDIIICIKSNFPMPDKDNLVIYDSDNKAKLRYTYLEKGQPWVDLSSYNYISYDHNINKMTTHIENAKHCVFLGYAIKIIRNTNTESFFINR